MTVRSTIPAPMSGAPAAPGTAAAAAGAGGGGGVGLGGSALGRAWSDIEAAVLLVTCLPLEQRLAEAGLPETERLTRCPKCGQKLLANHHAVLCDACEASPPPWTALVTLGPYADPLAPIVREIKNRPWPELADRTGRILGQRLAARLTAAGVHGPLLLLIPVPTSRLRILYRGIDHPAAIARGMCRGLRELHAEVTNPPGNLTACLAPLLSRRWRWRQAGLAAWRRKENVQGTMTPPRLGGLTGRFVPTLSARIARKVAQARQQGRPVVAVVVDDVVTTGATAREACRAGRAALSQQGISVRLWWVASVARADLPSV